MVTTTLPIGESPRRQYVPWSLSALHCAATHIRAIATFVWGTIVIMCAALFSVTRQEADMRLERRRAPTSLVLWPTGECSIDAVVPGDLLTLSSLQLLPRTCGSDRDPGSDYPDRNLVHAKRGSLPSSHMDLIQWLVGDLRRLRGLRCECPHGPDSYLDGRPNSLLDRAHPASEDRPMEVYLPHLGCYQHRL